MFNTKYSPFYIITVAFIIILIVPFLIQDGMFMDGEQYACVARNLANGKGSFWLPIVNDTWIMQGSPYFLEHPPLFYNLESFVFRIFGNSMYSERLFCLLMAFTNAFLIHRLWKLITPKNETAKHLSWLPILLWIIIPICFWAFQHNMIEIVLSVFTLLSVFFALKALLKIEQLFINLIFSGLFVFAAFLTKGLPGLFPLATIPLFYIITKNITLKQTLLYTLAIITIPFICYFLIISLSQDAKQSLQFYINERLLNRVYTTATTNYRLSILVDLVLELLLPIFLTLLIIAYSRKKTNVVAIQKSDKQYALLFLSFGLCGSLPLMATMVQKNFYFVASLPFFAFAFAFISYNYVIQLINLISIQWLKKIKIIAYTFLVLSILFSLLQIGKTRRDNEKLNDIKYLGGYLKNENIVGVDNDAYFDWSFQFYIYRKYAINLDPRNRHRTYIITKTDTSEGLLKDYRKIDLPLKQFKLYKQK
jgi:hypothetical protein